MIDMSSSEGLPQEFFASPDVEDVQAAVQKCVDDLRGATVPGSSCKLRGGTYRLKAPVLINGFDQDIPKFITAADPENRPKFDGTVDITSYEWSPVVLKNCPSGCFATEFSGDKPWQLFIGEDMFLNARWPNAKWSDKSLFEATKGWAQSSKKSTFAGPSVCAKAPDANGACPSGTELVTEGVAKGACQDTVTMECQAGKTNGQIATLGPAECFMDDATPTNDYGSKPLGEEDFDATDASVIVNNGHWMSYTGKVKSHSPMSNSFTYESRDGWNVMKFINDHTIYYLENSIELLDTPGEWFYGEGKIYIMPPKDETPASWAKKMGPITARVQTYAFKITEARKLTLSNMDFFGTTIFAAGERGPWDNVNKRVTQKPIMEHVWDNLIFKYPSTGKRMLGELDYIAPTTMRMHNSYEGPVWNTIRNSKFYYVEGPTIDFGKEQGITIENNLFEWIDWTATSAVTEAMKRVSLCFPKIQRSWCFGAGASSLWLPSGSDDAPNRIVRNTLIHTGASSGIGFFGKGSNMLVELNRIADKKDLQLDGGQITIPGTATSGIVLRRNWAYDSSPARGHSVKWGLRFDRGQSDCSQKWGKNGAMYNNVVFNTNGINLKGNEHTLVQNTVFWSQSLGGKLDDPNANPQAVDVNLYGSRGGTGTCECTDSGCKSSDECCNVHAWSKENALTVVEGNLMDSCAGVEGGLSWKVSTQDVDNQYMVKQGIANAAFNVAGESLVKQLRDPVNFDFRPISGSVASRQCIGAYADVTQDGTAEYWIPGHQEGLPTMPVPPTRSTTMKRSGSLAFNQALGADSHRVYVSDSSTADGGFEIELTTPSNLVGLPAAYSAVGHQYYWRVDPVFAGAQKTGAVWQYQVMEDKTSTGVIEADSVPPCVTFQGKAGPTDKTWTQFDLNVPANAGLGRRLRLKSTKVCVRSEGEFNTGYQFRLMTGNNQQKMLGAFWGQKQSIVSQIPDINGCFSDEGQKYEASSVVPGATWKPFKGNWEKIDTIDEFVDQAGLAKSPVTFGLKIKDQKRTGEVKAWSMEFCFEKSPEETLPAAGTGLCPKHGYA